MMHCRWMNVVIVVVNDAAAAADDDEIYSLQSGYTQLGEGGGGGVFNKVLYRRLCPEVQTTILS